jgi:hypothetical protein
MGGNALHRGKFQASVTCAIEVTSLADRGKHVRRFLAEIGPAKTQAAPTRVPGSVGFASPPLAA